MTEKRAVTDLTDQELADVLLDLRKKKQQLQDTLRVVVAEHDRRAMLRDMERRYGKKAMHSIVGVGGIASQEKTGG